MSVYTGKLSVEGDEFKLEAERLIVRCTEVAFHLSGADAEGGTYSIEGKATSRNATSLSQGTGILYVSEDLPVKYKHIVDDGRASFCPLKASNGHGGLCR